MLSFIRTLVFPHEFTAFVTNYAARTKGVELSLETLNTGLVRGFFNSKEELIGGYVIRSGQNLRAFSFLSKEQRANIALRDFECCEIACMWNHKEKLSPFDTAKLYFHSHWDAALLGKRYVVAGTIVPQVRRRIQKTLVKQLWSGTVQTSRGAPPIPYWIQFNRSFLVLPYFLFQVFPETAIEIRRFLSKPKQPQAQLTSKNSQNSGSI